MTPNLKRNEKERNEKIVRFKKTLFTWQTLLGSEYANLPEFQRLYLEAIDAITS